MIGSHYPTRWAHLLLRLAQPGDHRQTANEPPLNLDSAEQIFYDDTIRFADGPGAAPAQDQGPDPWVVEGQRTLVGWDYSATRDSAAAAYFNVICHNIFKLTFRDELPEEELWPTGGDRWYAVLTILMRQVENPWWDDVRTPDKIETRDDILLAAMTNARREITSLMARDTDQWQWGKLHTVRLQNPTLGRSGIKPVEQPVQSRSLSGRRRRPSGGQCHGVRRPGGVCRDGRSGDADAHRSW